jgi:cell division initiation protein
MKMRLTPLDIREQQFRRVMRGLDPDEVQQFLAAVAGEFETVVTSSNELRQRVVELEEKIGEYRSMEKALRDTLLTAEKVMGDAKESAQREAALILREAELAAERTRGRVTGEMQRLQDELAGLRRLKDAYVARVRWLLRSNLELLEGNAHEFSELDRSLSGGPALEAAPQGRPLPAAPSAPFPSALPPPGESPQRGVAPPPVWTQAPPPLEVWRPAGAGEPRAVPNDPRITPAETRPPGAERFGPDALGRPQASPELDIQGGRGSAAGRPPLLEPEEWRLVQPARTPAGVGGLDDVLRPVEPDGTYGAPSAVELPHALSAEEITQAARRAERLAAEARAALERHGLVPPAGNWPEDRGRGESPPGRP